MDLIERIRSYQTQYKEASTPQERSAILQSYTADRKLIGGQLLQLLTMPPFGAVRTRLRLGNECIVHYYSHADDSRTFELTDEMMLERGIVALVNVRFTDVNRDGIRSQTSGYPVYIK